MDYDVKIDFELAKTCMRNMNQYRLNFLQHIVTVAKNVTDSINYYKGKLADQNRTKLYQEINGGIQAQYRSLNNLMYELEQELVNQSDINMSDLSYAIFSNDQIDRIHNSAWNFEYLSNTEVVSIKKEEAAAVFNTVKTELNSSLQELENLKTEAQTFADRAYTTYSSGTIATICNNIESQVSSCIGVVESIINNDIDTQMTSSVSSAQQFGSAIGGVTAGAATTEKFTQVAPGVWRGEKRTNTVSMGTSRDNTDASVDNKFSMLNGKDKIIDWEYRESEGSVRDVMGSNGKPIISESNTMTDKFLDENPAFIVGSEVYGGKSAETATKITYFADGSSIKATIPNGYDAE